MEFNKIKNNKITKINSTSRRSDINERKRYEPMKLDVPTLQYLFAKYG